MPQQMRNSDANHCLDTTMVENEVDSFSYRIDTTRMDDQIDSISMNYCFTTGIVNYSPFVSDESSIFESLLRTEMELPKPQRKRVIELNDLSFIEEMKGSRLEMLSVSSFTKDSSETPVSSSSSESSDGSDDFDSDSSSEDETSNVRRIPVGKKPKVQPKQTGKKKMTTESDKRNMVMKLNQEYSSTLKTLNDDVVKAYKKWKALEKNGQPCEYAKNEWMYLNKKYTSMKRRNAREIFDKVQSINRKMNINENVYDLHGQGVKCGNLQYILKRIVSKEEKKLEEVVKNENNNDYVLDVGNESDGDWHKHAKMLVVCFLHSRKMKFSIDEEKRYITVHV